MELLLTDYILLDVHIVAHNYIMVVILFFLFFLNSTSSLLIDCGGLVKTNRPPLSIHQIILIDKKSSSPNGRFENKLYFCKGFKDGDTDVADLEPIQSIYSPIALVCGTTVGAGILALPRYPNYSSIIEHYLCLVDLVLLKSLVFFQHQGG